MSPISLAIPLLPAPATPAREPARLMPPAAVAPGASEPATVERPRADSVPAVASLARAAEDAARQLFTGRAVEISSFLDERSGRYVTRVADRETGRVIAQTPPEELLRFFASARVGDARALVATEA